MSLTSLVSLTGQDAVTSIGRHQRVVSASVSHLSSGDRIASAYEDVAGLSVATKLATRVTTLRSAQLNSLQAESLLQVADGALAEIQTILNRMQAIALQANSGSLLDSERQFLNLEFQQMKAEIDRIGESTDFNGVKVLQGDKATTELIGALMSDETLTDSGSAILQFVSNPGNNRRVRIQNLQFQFRNAVNPNNPLHVQRGATLSESVNNFVNALNAYSQLDTVAGRRIDEASYTKISPTAIQITSKSAGHLSRFYTIDEQGSSARNHFNTIGGIQVNPGGQNRYILGSFDLDGLGMNSVQAAGSTNNDLISSQNQTTGEVRLSLTGQPNNNQRLRIDNGFNGTNQFRFRTNANPANAFHIQIGATVEDTIKNAVVKLTEWVETFGANRNTHVHRQLEFQRDGTDLVMRFVGVGNAMDTRENNAQFLENMANATLSANLMTNGADSGVNLQGISNNSAFIGEISGFEAQYLADNQVRLSLTVGEHTYQADTATVFDGTNNRLRLHSEDGGFFEIEFDNKSAPVENQDDADVFADRLDFAFSGLTFYQEREITTYRAAGDLADTRMTMRLQDFDTPLLFEDVEVIGVEDAAALSETGAIVSMTINGETFRSTTFIDNTVDPYLQIVMQSVDNPERQITFFNDTTEFDVVTDDDAEAFEALLRAQLPIGETLFQEGGSVGFQVGDTPSEQLTFVLETTSTNTIFDDTGIGVETIERAVQAFDAVVTAQDAVTARRAYVGSLQIRAESVTAGLESAIVQQEAARGVVGDTDVASESTLFAVASVRVQAAIAIVTQTNLLRSDILNTTYGAIYDAAVADDAVVADETAVV